MRFHIKRVILRENINAFFGIHFQDTLLDKRLWTPANREVRDKWVCRFDKRRRTDSVCSTWVDACLILA